MKERETTTRGLGDYKNYICNERDNKHEALLMNAEGGDLVDGENTAVTISVICDTENEATISSIVETKGSSYLIQLLSSYACPTEIDQSEDDPQPIFDAAACKFTTADEFVFDLSEIMGVSLSYSDPLFENEILINTCALCSQNGQSVCLTTYDKESVGAGSLASLAAEEYCFFLFHLFLFLKVAFFFHIFSNSIGARSYFLHD
jgi:hypothetical protein